MPHREGLNDTRKDIQEIRITLVSSVVYIAFDFF